ncbi:MAG: membrane protein FxsA [Mesorhizobium sp. 61-13]|nr:MAG: membrane protein FxsA [Mesorhizobium sp. 61-13]
MRISFLPLLILALPLAEIAGFVVVGSKIGALATIGLVLASTIAGSLLIRHQGFGVMTKVRTEMDAGRDPSAQLAHGAMMVFAAILLIIPGFITSILGLLLLLPPVRDMAWRHLKKRVAVVTEFGTAGFRPRQRGKTIDLNDDDYKRGNNNNPNASSPWRQISDE